MDLFEELEQMALNVAEEPSKTELPSDDTIQRWQKLFNYSHGEALTMIEKHRNDLTRKRITEEHWDMVREKLEIQGYDREAYEYELTRGREKVVSSQKEASKTAENGRYLIKLEGLITAKLIQGLSNASQPVEIIHGNANEEDTKDTKACIINSTTKSALLEKVSSTAFKPTIIRLSEPAPKNLSSTSRYPTLGIDTTLPQHRPSNDEFEFLPTQNQYPVWYFFYGTLADPSALTRHLGLSSEPMLWPATIRGGILKTWAGKYRALVDSPEDAVVEGSAYEIQCKEHEDALRSYETSKYEVVRCVIEVGYRRIPGCTFRFVGSVDG